MVSRLSGDAEGGMKPGVDVVCFAVALAAQAQQSGAIRGRVTDESGAVVPSAVVAIAEARGFSRQLLTNESGTYEAKGLAPGRYALRVAKPGFAIFEGQPVELVPAGSVTYDVRLNLESTQQRITVQETAGTLSTDPVANAGALVLNSSDLEALSDDPEELLADLKALAGPGSGLKGSDVYVDGFKSGRLPPKESIREVRINQNPFSAEYDRMGLGRIEVFTKPGTDKFHGMLALKYGNAALNSRNPYSSDKPPYYSAQSEGEVGGPLGKSVSFLTHFEEQTVGDNAVIHATVLDPELRIRPVSGAIAAPHHETTFDQRIDVQLTRDHTLTIRYEWAGAEHDNAGVGSFDLASHGYHSSRTSHTLQLAETAVLGPRTINETRLQFARDGASLLADNSRPTVVVLAAFSGGGAAVGHSFRTLDHYELQNYTSYATSTHTLKFGGRLRIAALTDHSERNFVGTFTFSGGLAPELDSAARVVLDAAGQPVLTPITSIESYRRTLLLQQQGLAASTIRSFGGGPSQFSIIGGRPQTSLTATDMGVYVQDDWRVHPGFTLSTGLRYEAQDHLRAWTQMAPRIGFAWAPRARAGRPPKLVIRGGAGFFYDRFGEDLVLQTMRFDGVTQQHFVVYDPEFFPNVPALTALAASRAQTAVRQVDAHLQAPRVMQGAIGIERELPSRIALAATYIHSRAVHLFLSRNINAPLPGTFAPNNPFGGLRPYGPGNIYQYESSGILNQEQLHVNLSRRFRGRFSAFGYYSYGRAFSTSDGPNSFPANQYNLRGEYGRAATDIRHQVVIGGSIMAPFHVSLSPFLIGRSGAPFAIVTGGDANGNSVFTDRPAFATDLNKPGIVVTRFGTFDPNPPATAALIPRNYGQAPSFFNLNVRLSWTIGLGSVQAPKKKSKSASKAASGDPADHGMTLGANENSLQSILRDSKTEHRFNLTLSVTARNILNHVNPGIPVGNLTSPLFGQSNWLASSSGPEDLATGNNRRIVFRVRLGF
jgi:hypothetical protein